MGSLREPTLLGLLVGTAVLAGLVMFGVPVVSELKCERPDDVCRFTRRFLGGTRGESQRVANLRDARVTVTVRPFLSARFTVLVAAGNSTFWFMGSYAEKSDAEGTAGRINTFLKDPKAKRLDEVYSQSRALWLALGMVPIGAYLLVGLLSQLADGISRRRVKDNSTSPVTRTTTNG
jgi:hypothetical protein